MKSRPVCSVVRRLPSKSTSWVTTACPVEYHVTFWKSELIDFVILQQDAFDEVDAVTPMERQEEILNMVIEICHTEFEFDNFNEVMDYFKKMINICKQMNYSKFKSEEYEKFHKQLQELVEERKA